MVETAFKHSIFKRNDTGFVGLGLPASFHAGWLVEHKNAKRLRHPGQEQIHNELLWRTSVL